MQSSRGFTKKIMRILKEWDLKVGVSQWEWQAREIWDCCHLASTERSATQQRNWPLSPSPRPEPGVRYFAHGERQAREQSSNLISNPQGTDFNCNEVQRSSSLRELWKAIKIMVKGNWEEIYRFTGDKGYLGGCSHFSGEKWGQWQLGRTLLSQISVKDLRNYPLKGV